MFHCSDQTWPLLLAQADGPRGVDDAPPEPRWPHRAAQQQLRARPEVLVRVVDGGSQLNHCQHVREQEKHFWSSSPPPFGTPQLWIRRKNVSCLGMAKSGEEKRNGAIYGRSWAWFVRQRSLFAAAAEELLLHPLVRM